jgi:hypothetical protein
VAEKRPIVLVDGQLQQLALGDTLPFTSFIVTGVSVEDTYAVMNVSEVAMASNADRKRAWVTNISDAYVWVSLSGTADIAKPTKLAPGQSFTVAGPEFVYTGDVAVIHDSSDFGEERLIEIVELE